MYMSSRVCSKLTKDYEQFKQPKVVIGEKAMWQGDLLLIQMTILIIIAIVHVVRHWNK